MKMEERIKRITGEFPKTNLVITFTINKRGTAKLQEVKTLDNSYETEAIINDDEESLNIKELRRYVG